MTQEEKAKAYDEALKRAREIIRNQNASLVWKDWLRNNFPGLNESEDERIKKGIISFLRSKNGYMTPDEDWDFHNRWLPWLEKQGQEESIDMSIKEKAHQIAWETSKHYDPLLSKESWCEMAALDMASWLEKQGKQKSPFNKERLFEIAKPETFEEKIEHWQRMRGIAEERVKELLEKQGEQKPIIEMKSAEESLGIDSDTYNKIEDECIWGEQKSNPCDGCINRKGCINCENGDMKETEHKVEPKFNVGDLVVWDNKISCHIDNIYQGKESLMYTITDSNNMTRSYSVKGFDNNAHLWTIEDAKDGDVLWHSDTASNGIFIFKEIRHNGKVLCYCDYDSEDHFCTGEYHTCCWSNDKYIKPATKEQCDLLFSKMKEAGYEWDSENKQLLSLKAEPEEIKDGGKKELRKIGKNSNDRLDPLIDEEIDLWIKENGDIHHDDNNIIGLMRDMAYYVATLTRNLYRQKPKWTEEDEGMLNHCIGAIHIAGYHVSNTYTNKDKKMMKDWLNSVKQRMKG